MLHPPTLSVFTDDDLDGVADRQETLIEGISTDYVNRRGADHTTNGIRMGIDGWIYIAVGDFGFTAAKAKDGVVLSRRGGGIVRIRPDGSNMEIYAWGLRNIMDVCIDPMMNIFTRDNTNDGGGWNVRLSHIFQSGHYGYPSRYLNYTDEIMPTLRDYGGGSGCGGMFLDDLRWPAPYQHALYTCDWGRSEVYRHNLPAHGPTFEAHQEVFVKTPRPTDMDVDGSGRMYISSWKNGNFNFKGPNVGFVAQLVPRDFVPKPFPRLAEAALEDLVRWHSSPSAVYRLHSQRELLRRAEGSPQTTVEGLSALAAHAADAQQPLAGRVAAIYSLKQAGGMAANAHLARLAQMPEVREHALRALTDRRDQLDNVPLELLVKASDDANPRVVAQAVISLGRLGPQSSEQAQAAERRLLTLAHPVAWPSDKEAHAQLHPSAVIPHLATRALADRQAIAVCLKAIGGEGEQAALRVLRWTHTEEAVEGLIQRLGQARDPQRRHALLATLSRLYYHEGEFRSGWWGTRPDRTGPYFDRQTWASSSRIGQVLKTAVADSPPQAAQALLEVMKRHQLKIEGLDLGAKPSSAAESTQPITIVAADPDNPRQIGNLGVEAARAAAEQSDEGDVERGRKLFASQSCAACHTVVDGQTPKGPHLVDIGKRYQRPGLIESILKPSAKIAQGFDTYAFRTSDGKVFTGFVVSESAETITMRQATGVVVELPQDDIERRVKQPISMMPQGIVNNLTVEQLADLLAYLRSL